MYNKKIFHIAKICHEANRLWCLANEDYSQKPWDEAKQWQRNSAIKGVEFRLANPNAGKDAQHNAWMEDKIQDGWVYGEVKDAEKKTHPCLVPFGLLPEFQQKKDALFCAIVDALAGPQPVPFSRYHTYTSFGEAIKAAKQGKRVARLGWNGQGMYAYIVPANSYPAQTEIARNEFGDMVPYRAYWALKTAQGDIATWAPSGSDSLAEDWIVLD